MNNKIVYFILMFFIASSLCAQKKVAIYVTGGDNPGINKVLGDKLVEGFVKSGKYTAIERSSVFLAELSKERPFNETGKFTDNDLINIAKTFGVDLVCVAEVSEVLGEKYVSARLIDIQTAEIITTSNSDNLVIKTMPDLIAVSDKIAFELSGKTGKEQYAQNVKEKQQKEFSEAVGNLAESISNLLAGTIILTNKDKDPFDVYINNQYIGVIQGYTSIQRDVAPGDYSVKVVEKSGYVLNQQVELFNVRINNKKSVVCKWD